MPGRTVPARPLQEGPDLVGNADTHDALASVEQAEVADLARLCQHLLTVVYQTPAWIRRARQYPPTS